MTFWDQAQENSGRYALAFEWYFALDLNYCKKHNNNCNNFQRGLRIPQEIITLSN